MAVMDIIIKAQDQASKVMETVGKSGEKAGNLINDNLGKIAIASAGAGVGIEGMARSQAHLQQMTETLSKRLNMGADEFRDLATETSNVTFPLEDVIDLMEQGTERGIESADALKEYATFWDTVGDATGENATQLGKAGVALQQLGIDAGNEAEALGAFGYMAENTTQDLGEFLTFVDRVGPDISAMGLNIDDTTAILGAMENELGLTGRTARQEFQQAINDSDGDLVKVMDTLGLTKEQFHEYKDAVQASSDVIQEQANDHADSYTAMQKLQHGASELAYKFGDVSQSAATMAPLLLAVGPILKGLTLAKKGYAVATKAAAAASRMMGVAMRFMLGPVGLVIIAITAAVAIGWYLFKNWDEVVALVKSLWKRFAQWFSGIWEQISAWFSGVVAKIADFFRNAFEKMRDVGRSISEAIRTTITTIFNAIKTYFTTVLTIYKTIFMTIFNAIRNKVSTIVNAIKSGILSKFNAIKNYFTKILNFYRNIFTTVFNAIRSVITTIVNAIKNSVTSAFTSMKNSVTTVFNRIRSVASSVFGSIRSKIQSIVGGLKSFVVNTFNAMKSGVASAFEGILSRGRSIFNRLVGVIKSPLNKVIGLVNRMLSGIGRAKISIPKIPKWVPIIGGKGGGSIGFPNPPRISRLHTGGEFKADKPGGEGTALLRDGEVVRSREQQRSDRATGSGNGSIERKLDKMLTLLTRLLQDRTQAPLLVIENFINKSEMNIEEIADLLNDLIEERRNKRGYE